MAPAIGEAEEKAVTEIERAVLEAKGEVARTAKIRKAGQTPETGSPRSVPQEVPLEGESDVPVAVDLAIVTAIGMAHVTAIGMARCVAKVNGTGTVVLLARMTTGAAVWARDAATATVMMTAGGTVTVIVVVVSGIALETETDHAGMSHVAELTTANGDVEVEAMIEIEMKGLVSGPACS